MSNPGEAHGGEAVEDGGEDGVAEGGEEEGVAEGGEEEVGEEEEQGKGEDGEVDLGEEEGEAQGEEEQQQEEEVVEEWEPVPPAVRGVSPLQSQSPIFHI